MTDFASVSDMPGLARFFGGVCHACGATETLKTSGELTEKGKDQRKEMRFRKLTAITD